MFAKLVVTIVALGACCCTLLFLRQGRIFAASEMARVQTKVRQQDEELWKLRVRIAEKVAPQHVTLMSRDIGPLHPLAPEQPLLALEKSPANVPPREVVTVAGQTATDASKAEIRKAAHAKLAKPATGKNKKNKSSTPALPSRASDSRLAKKNPEGNPR